MAKNETIELVDNANDAIAKSWQQLSNNLNLPDSISLPSEHFKLKEIPGDAETIKRDAKTIDLNV